MLHFQLTCFSPNLPTPSPHLQAQLVANSSSAAAVMASQMWRRHAWVVTGTPISSKLDEIRGLCEFLALEPYYQSTAWNQLLHSPHNSSSLGGLLSMRGLLKVSLGTAVWVGTARAVGNQVWAWWDEGCFNEGAVEGALGQVGNRLLLP